MIKKKNIFLVLCIFLVLVSTTFLIADFPDWIIQGNSVYFDDSNVFINVTPHTSNYPVIEFISKDYTGLVDIVVGFDTDDVLPTKAETNPHLENVTVSYTCDFEFNYTLNPNYFWCFKNVSTSDSMNVSNGSYLEIIYEHSFIVGDIDTQTANWSEEKIIWDDVSGAFSDVDLDFMGFDKWYFKDGFNVNAGQTYDLRLSLSPFTFSSYKYFFGVKPSSETLFEAIDRGHFYYIDPWSDSLNNGLEIYYDFDASSGTVLDEKVSHVKNGTLVNTPTWTTGIIGNSLRFNASSSELVNITDGAGFFDSDTVSVSFWIYPISNWSTTQYFWDATGNRNYHVIQDNSWDFRMGGVTNIFVDPTDIDGDDVAPWWSLNNWHHIVVVYETDESVGANQFWADGVNYVNSTVNWTNSDSISIYLGSRYSLSNYLDARLDEFGVWNRTLSGAEIVQLYNSGVGISYSSDYTNPSVVIVSPIGTKTSTNVTFNFTLSDEVALSYCEYNVTTSGLGVVVANNGINCSNSIEYQTISEGVGYIVNVLVNDTSNNLNHTSAIFDVSLAGGSADGGGSSPDILPEDFNTIWSWLRTIYYGDLSLSDSAKLYNPDVYDDVAPSWNAFFVGSENIGDLGSNLFNAIRTTLKYIFRQPASLGGVE